MRKKSFLVLIILTFVLEGVIAGILLYRSRDIEQDTVAINTKSAATKGSRCRLPTNTSRLNSNMSFPKIKIFLGS